MIAVFRNNLMGSKRIKLIRAIFAIGALIFSINVKSQSTCGTATVVSTPFGNYTVSSYTASNYWIKTTTGAGTYNITINTKSGSTGKITRADVYTGSCAGLTLFQTDTLLLSTDTVFIISLADTSSTDYYIKLTNSPGSTNFKVSSVTELYIGGDIGYCPGSTVTLTTIVNASGSGPYSYHWSTGATTSSISLTNPSPATYTLSYTDGGGTYTTSITTFTLPANACKNCELVQNGSFESYFNQTNNLSGFNQNPNLSVPEYWFIPTPGGSSDCFNTNFCHAFNDVCVPGNDFTSAVNGGALTGHGYAGGWISAYEYIEEALKCPLVAGQLYNISYSTKLGDKSNKACNNVGMFLSSGPITSTATILSYTPQINMTSVNTNYTSWTQTIGTFMGNGEQYITLGNFYSSANTSTVTSSGTMYGCYYFIDDISITPATPTLSVSSATVNCSSANTITLTATGAATNTTTVWYGGFGSPHYGSPCVVPTPTATTTYTCSITPCTLGCTAITQTITVTGNGPPTILISPASPTVCYGSNSATLTATGASTYTWSPSTGLSCTTCSATVASPTATTSYTVVGSTGTCTASTAITVTVNANNCSGTSPSSYSVSAGTLSANPAFIASSFTIATGGAYTINSADVRIAPGVQIRVQPSATLTINNSWLHACAGCSGSMWQGIYVENGGVLTVNTATTNFSIIEDASQAVTTASSASATPVPVFQITNTIFNKNTKGIYLDQHPGAYTNSTPPYNCIFTCRSLNSHAVTSTNFSNIKTDISSATPINTSTTNPTGTTLAGTRSTHGVYLNNRSLSTATMVVGYSAGGNNVFDNLDYGIYCYESNLKVVNSKFQNLTGNDRPLHNPIGIGIYAYNTIDGLYALQVGNGNTTYVSSEANTFLSCCMGVYTQLYRKEWINGNSFDCEATASGFNTTSLVAGEYGVANIGFGAGGGTSVLEQLQFANNTMNNYANGYYHDYSEIFNTAATSSYWYNNTISSYTTSASPNNYVDYNLYLNSNDGMTYTAVPQNSMQVEANTFTNAKHNAITAAGVGITSASGGLTIYHNTELGVKYVSTYTAQQSPPVAAIYLNGCKYVKVSDNTNIKCTGLSSYPSTNAQYLHGVYVDQSTNSIVSCNVVNYMGEGYTWNGTCTGSTWYRNSVQNSRFGLVLRSSGSMGDQGSSGHPIGDLWGKQVSTNITDAHTLADASNPSTSPTSTLYCGASTCTSPSTPMPCVNTFTNAGTAYSSGTTLRITTGTSPQVCLGDGGGGRVMSSVLSDSSSIDSLALINLVDGIENGDTLPVYDPETRWAVQYYVSSQDSAIAPATNYGNAKTMALIDAAIAIGDFVKAISLNNSVAPANTIETNWQQVTSILIRKVSDTSYHYTEADISTLASIAAQCPLSGGSVVFKARTMVNSYYGGITQYSDACQANNGDGAKANTIMQILAEKSKIILYPNPNSGSMIIEYYIKQDAVLEMTDISGKLVGRYNLPATENMLQIKNDKLENGVYLYRIVTSNNLLKTGKLAIIK